MSLFSPSITVILADMWASLSDAEKMLFLKDEGLNEILNILCNSELSNNNRRTSFKNFVTYFRGINYSELELDFRLEQKSLYYVDRYSLAQKEEKFESLVHLLDNMSTRKSELTESLFLNEIGKLWLEGLTSRNIIEVGLTSIMDSERLFPFSNGLKDYGRIPVTKDLFSSNICVIIPDEFQHEKEEISKWFYNYIIDRWKFGLLRAAVWKRKFAIEGAHSREKMDAKNVNWQKWIDVGIWTAINPEKRNLFIDYSNNVEDVMLSVSELEKLYNDFEGKSVEWLYNDYCNNYLTWKDYYGSRVNNINSLPDQWHGRSTKVIMNDSSNIDKEYSLWMYNGNLYDFGRNWFFIYSNCGEELAKFYEKEIVTNLEYDRWLLGKFAPLKFVEEIGGEAKYPNLYSKPGNINDIPERPKKIPIQNYNGHDRIDDIPEVRWEKEYSDVIDLYKNKSAEYSSVYQSALQNI